jgi:uridylate kinase
MGKNGVDGVYDSDPRRNPDAKKLDRLTYTDALVNRLGVMDDTALAMCRDNDVQMRVFGMEGEGNVTRALAGEPIGTLITAR